MKHATARIAAAIAAGLCAGCAGLAAPDPPQHAPALAAPAAMQRIAVGSSRKPEVSAALGPAIEIPFDSGYEVWVYRWPGPDRSTRAATELVVLFDPSGRAAKVRLKPGYPPP